MPKNRRMSPAINITLGILVAALTVISSQSMPAYSQKIPSVNKNVDLGSSFDQFGITGSIIIYDLNNKKFYEHNTDRNSQAFLPASTFKIFNSLVALETGVIPNDVAVLTWDGKLIGI